MQLLIGHGQVPTIMPEASYIIMIQIKYALIKIRMPDKKHCRLNTSV